MVTACYVRRQLDAHLRGGAARRLCPRRVTKGRRESEGREIGRRNRGWESTGPFFGHVLAHVLITSRPYTPGGQVELLRWNEKDVTNDGGVYLKVRTAVEALPRRAAAFAVGSPRRPDPRSGRAGVTTEGDETEA